MASNASAVMAMRIKRQARRVSDLLQPAFFCVHSTAVAREPLGHWRLACWADHPVVIVGNGKQHAHRHRTGPPHRPTGNNPAHSSAWP
jgi:hypothetical protein